jgi:hypothetical protein
MLMRALVVLVVVFAVSAPLASVQRPNLSGTWVASTDAPAGIAAAPSPTLGPRFALRMDGTSLTVTRPAREDTLAVTYALDGSRSSYRIPGRLCAGEAQVFETAAWEGSALALTVVGQLAAGAVKETTLSVKRVMRPVGDTLVVEATITKAGAPSQVATVYKKSTEALPAPKPAASFSGPAATIAQVEWIAGTWSGLNGSLTVEERWTPAASGGMIGVGRTLRGTSLSNFEFLCIAERQGTLVYVAMPDARTPATFFTLTNVTADSATFENPSHDFPKLIRYSRRADGSLETAISAGGTSKPTTFVLQRQQ